MKLFYKIIIFLLLTTSINAQIKLSALPSASTIASADLFLMTQSSVSKSTTFNLMGSYFIGTTGAHTFAGVLDLTGSITTTGLGKIESKNWTDTTGTQFNLATGTITLGGSNIKGIQLVANTNYGQIKVSDGANWAAFGYNSALNGLMYSNGDYWYTNGNFRFGGANGINYSGTTIDLGDDVVVFGDITVSGSLIAGDWSLGEIVFDDWSGLYNSINNYWVTDASTGYTNFKVGGVEGLSYSSFTGLVNLGDSVVVSGDLTMTGSLTGGVITSSNYSASLGTNIDLTNGKINIGGSGVNGILIDASVSNGQIKVSNGADWSTFGYNSGFSGLIYSNTDKWLTDGTFQLGGASGISYSGSTINLGDDVEISGDITVSGSLTGGIVQSGTSGQRVKMESGDITFYDAGSDSVAMFAVGGILFATGDFEASGGSITGTQFVVWDDADHYIYSDVSSDDKKLTLTNNAAVGDDVGLGIEFSDQANLYISVASTLKTDNNFDVEGATIYGYNTYSITAGDISDNTISAAGITYLVIDNDEDPCNITTIEGGVQGQILYIYGSGTNTFVTTFIDGATLKLSGNFAMDDYDALTLIYNGSEWVQLSESNN